MFTNEQLNIVQFCAEECVRQGKTDPMSTYHMLCAWDYASFQTTGEEPRKIDIQFIEQIGKLIEPQENINGIRRKPIMIGNERRDADRLADRLNALIEAYYDGRLGEKLEEVRNGWIGHTAIAKSAEDQFYYEFENIHPFGDGNGRTGKVLYNYLINSMENPQMPPNFWNIANP